MLENSQTKNGGKNVEKKKGPYKDAHLHWSFVLSVCFVDIFGDIFGDRELLGLHRVILNQEQQQ